MAAQIFERFQFMIQELTKHADNLYRVLNNEQSPQWFLAQDELSPYSDPESVREPFSRQEMEDKFRQAVAGDQSGTVGDLVSVGLQGPFLQAAEAAFRSRHMSFVRSAAHAAARLRGHAQDTGPLYRAYIGYLQFLQSLDRPKSS